MVLPGITEGRLLVGTDDPEKIADFYLEGRPQVVIVKVGAPGSVCKNEIRKKDDGAWALPSSMLLTPLAQATVLRWE